MRLAAQRYSKRRLFLFVIPFLFGLGGVIFSQQFADAGVRAFVLVVSLAVPVFAVGSLLSRFHSGWVERALLFAGLVLLGVGAAIGAGSAADTAPLAGSESLLSSQASRVIGMVSLALGLMVVLIMTLRRGEDVEEFADRFWLLAEHIKEGFVLSDAEGTIFSVNRRFLEMIGLDESEVIGRNARDLADQMGVDMVRTQLDNRARGISSEYEVSFRVRGEDRRFAFSGTPIFTRQGAISATLATVRDVTDQYRLAQRVDRYAKGLQQLVEEQTQKLIQSEERFRQLLLSMNEGFITLDARNRVRFANAHIRQLLGIDETALLGREVFELVEPASRATLLNLLSQGAGIQEKASQREVQLLHASGESIPALVGVAYVRDDVGEGQVYSLVLTAVKDLKELQAKLEARARDLERANAELRMHDRAKDSFLSNVSHELRTPLSTIQGYIEMIASGSLGGLAEDQAAALKVMARNAERLSLLINEMIEFSRMEIRGAEVQPELRSPRRLVRDAVASARPHALKKNIALTVEMPEDLPHAWFDREKMNQVLGILLNNAIKFTDPGGSVRVTVAREAGGTLSIAVSDTGIGIDPMYQAKVFEKFFQVDSSKTRRYEGTGIGLSIAKSVVVGHGGGLRLESALGKGSTFTVVLPESLFDLDPALAGRAGLDGLRVLLVDEGKSFHECVGGALTALGAVVEFAESGYACVRAAAASRPDVLLVNDRGDTPDGAHVLTLLREQPDTAEIPVVVAASGRSRRVEEAGLFGAPLTPLGKPFNAVALVERLLEAARHAPAPERAAADAPGGGRLPRTLVADADDGLLEWVELALSRRNIACYCARDGAQALEIAAVERPDAVFVDRDIAGPNGNLADALHATPGLLDTPVYRLTGAAPEEGAAGGYEGDLRKPFDIDAMAAIVHAAARQRGNNAPPVGAA